MITKWKASESSLWIHGKRKSPQLRCALALMTSRSYSGVREKYPSVCIAKITTFKIIHSPYRSAIIEEIEGMRPAGLATMAYYYFYFRDVKKQDCYSLLSSLVSQLSAELYPCYQVLSQLYSDCARGTRKPTTGRLTQCLKDMLSSPGQGQIYIIVDALDESPDSGMPSAREEVLKLIEELVDLKLQNVHLCVASRPEMDIRTMLEPLIPLKISIHEESGHQEDIIEYIKFVVHSDRNMQGWKEEDKKLVVDTLSEKANGM